MSMILVYNVLSIERIRIYMTVICISDFNSVNLAFEDRIGLKGLFAPSVCVFWLDFFFFKKVAELNEELLLVTPLCISYINH